MQKRNTYECIPVVVGGCTESIRKPEKTDRRQTDRMQMNADTQKNCLQYLTCNAKYTTTLV